MLKFISRLKKYGYTLDDSRKPNMNLHAFRSHGAPCSCYACSQPETKYKRAEQKRKFMEALNEYREERMIDFEYMRWYFGAKCAEKWVMPAIP